MGKMANAIQPYAHYTPKLAQWQGRLHGLAEPGSTNLIMEFAPRAYDKQKASRITLYHALITFVLARIWIATCGGFDNEFRALINRLRIALGKSRYLDGKETVWDQQFWAVLVFLNGETAPE